MQLTIKEIKQAVGALNTNSEENNEQLTISGVEFDSRKIKKNNLFVPLIGARDGHDFVKLAIDQGAIAYFWAQDCHLAPKNVSAEPIFVADTLIAMQKLAKYYLQKNKKIKKIAITGSNGKTTTKDLTLATISTLGATFKTPENYNNEIGVPYTILQMPEKTEYLIVELGMDHFGDLHLLADLVRPQIAVITMIGESHLEFMQTRERIVAGKMQIADFNDELEQLIVPDEPLLTPFLKKIVPEKITKVGLTGENVDVSAQILANDQNKSIFTTSLSGKQKYRVNLAGAYNVRNALIAVTLALKLGGKPLEIAKSLDQAQITANRGAWTRRFDGAQIFADVYNANPTAMKLVLDQFAQTKVARGGRRIAVLADMLELGEQSKSLHQSLVEHLHPDQIELIFLYGEKMFDLAQLLRKIYPPKMIHFYQKNEQTDERTKLIADLKKEVHATDLVLLKGSHGMNLAEIAQELLKNSWN